MTVRVGNGTTIAFAGSGFTAEVVSMDLGTIEAEDIDTTHLGSTAPVLANDELGGKTYIPAPLQEPGEISLELHYNPDEVPPIGREDAITVQFPPLAGQATGAKIESDGYMKSIEAGIPTNGKMTGTAKVKLSGILVVTPGAA